MRKHAMAACLLMATLSVCAQTHEKDSLRVIDLQEVEIIYKFVGAINLPQYSAY